MCGNVGFVSVCLKLNSVVDFSYTMTRFARAIGSKSSNARVKADPTPWSEMAPPKIISKRNAESMEDHEANTLKDEPQTPPKKVAKIVKLGNAKTTPKTTPKPKNAKKEKVVSNNSEVLEKCPASQEPSALAVVTSNGTEPKVQEPMKKTKKQKTTISNGNGDACTKENIETKPSSVEVSEIAAATSEDAGPKSPKLNNKARKKLKKLQKSKDESSRIKDVTVETSAKVVQPSGENIETKQQSVEVSEIAAPTSGDAESKSPKLNNKARKKLKKLLKSKDESSSIKDVSIETKAEEVKPTCENNSEAANEKNGEKESNTQAKKKTGNKRNAKKFDKDNDLNSKLSKKNEKNGEKRVQGNAKPGSNSSEHGTENNYHERNNKPGNNQVADAWGGMKKKKVQCLRCRKMGHKANECKQERKGKMCYKCGDAQHTSRECSIQEEVYKFAECFICRQTGHLTRSCPSNTKGIYPRGGSCFKCGENTHLAKDCPSLRKAEEEKEDSKESKRQEVFAGILDAKQSADADVSESVSETPKNKKGRKQVVKF